MMVEIRELKKTIRELQRANLRLQKEVIDPQSLKQRERRIELAEKRVLRTLKDLEVFENTKLGAFLSGSWGLWDQNEAVRELKRKYARKKVVRKKAVRKKVRRR